MKSARDIFFVIAFILSANFAFAETWFCQAQCGGVRLVFSLAREGLVPVYSGSNVIGEGSTISQAYSALRSNCGQILHNEFDRYQAGWYIDLNTNVIPTQVCRKM